MYNKNDCVWDDEFFDEYYGELEKSNVGMTNNSVGAFDAVDINTYYNMRNEDKLYYLYNKINDILYLLSSNKDVLE